MTSELSTGQKPIRGLEKVKEAYKKKSDKTSILLVGPNGSGKSRMTGWTMPGPGLVHSFDPDGSDTYRELIVSESNPEGKIIVDTQFERIIGDTTTSRTEKTSWTLYEDEMRRLLKAGTFDDLAEQGGWYGLDSLSSFLETSMDHVQHYDLGAKKGPGPKSNRGKVPTRNEYHAQQVPVLETLRDLCSLPCTVVVTAHITFIENDDGNPILAAVLGPKGIKEKAPMYFSEVYYLRNKTRSEELGGTKYSVLTRNDGMFRASTRIGREGLFKKEEPADFTYLLDKAGKLKEGTEWLSKDFERIKKEQIELEKKKKKS